jgi:protein gp37
MAENSKIEWCDHTFNPWVGCTKVSPACDNCYAEGWAKRTGQAQLWRGDRRRTSAANWQQPLKWNRQAGREGRRFRVFCASLADVFDNQVPEAWRDDLWRLIAATPHLDWLLLTKRPQNIRKFIDGPALPNMWLGTTVENQEEADRRIPHLLATLAAVHFLSCEPLLGPVDLRPWLDRDFLTGCADDDAAPVRTVGWVIAGGESGPGARPMHPDWARSLRDQCAAAGVPFHFKQCGEWAPVCAMSDAQIDRCYHPAPLSDPDATRRPKVKSTVLHRDGTRFDDAAARSAYQQGAGAMMMKAIGKAAAGRLLDGREHDGMPA